METIATTMLVCDCRAFAKTVTWGDTSDTGMLKLSLWSLRMDDPHCVNTVHCLMARLLMLDTFNSASKHSNGSVG